MEDMMDLDNILFLEMDTDAVQDIIADKAEFGDTLDFMLGID